MLADPFGDVVFLARDVSCPCELVLVDVIICQEEVLDLGGVGVELDPLIYRDVGFLLPIQ